MRYHDLFITQGMRCVQQIALLRIWERLRGNDKLPDFRRLDSSEISRYLEKLLFFDLVRSDDDRTQFRVIYCGTQFERIFLTGLAGKFLEDFLPPALQEQAIRQYDLVASTREPSFSFSPVRMGGTAIVRYERLLLPFAHESISVERIVSVITLFTEENGFDARSFGESRIIDT